MRRTFFAATVVAAFICGIPVSATAATVTDLKAVHRNGQTFITFTKNVGSGTKTTYAVYRETAPITTIAGKTKIATLDADSWHLLYDDTWPPELVPKLSKGFVISDDGPQLTASQGLLVWTTAASGDYYYAVVNSDDPTTIKLGTNSIGAVAETHQTTPGGVRLTAVRRDAHNNADLYTYFRWEDYSTWRMDEWGYYGNKVSIFKPIGLDGVSAPYPIRVNTHGAGFGYFEPGNDIGPNPLGIEIYVRDNGMDSATVGNASYDPYTNISGGHGPYVHSGFGGRYDPTTDRVVMITERRITDYVRLTRDNAWGDGSNFEVDSNRIYIEGASLGSLGMVVAAHNPTVYTAALTSLPIIDSTAFSNGMTAPAGKLLSGTSIAWEDWENMKWLADQGYALPPIIFTYNKDDGTVRPEHMPAALTAFETAKLPFVAAWGGHTRAYPVDASGHSGYNIDADNGGGAWDLFRFKSNEAYPAFAHAANSDPFEAQKGQRNMLLDWGSALHPIAAPIEDTINSFGITLKALADDTSAEVTIRNAQRFRPGRGEVVTWRNLASEAGDVLQSGSAAADANGLVTIRLRITRAGNRLMLSCATCTEASAANARSLIRQPSPGAGLPGAPRNVRISP